MPSVGDRKIVEVEISNAILGLPLGAKCVIKELGSTTIKKVAQKVASEVTKKVGSKFIPGLNIVTCIAGLIALINASCGNDGFLVTVELEYTETYIHKEGYYVRGWNVKSLDVDVY